MTKQEMQKEIVRLRAELAKRDMALKLVLGTVEECHDCWNLSADESEIEFVDSILTPPTEEG